MTAALAALVLVGCLGTEGGNPGDPMDASSPDAGASRDAGPGSFDTGPGFRDAGPSFDAGPSRDGGSADAGPCMGDTGPEPGCDPSADAGMPCACTVGPVHEVAPGTMGRVRLLLRGPTASGGFVAVREVVCVTCSEPLHLLTVHRFDASGAPVGTPIEVTRSVAPNGYGATVDGDTLSLAWPDDRAGLQIWYARLDLASATWLTAARSVATPELPIGELTMARSASGNAIVWTGSGPDPRVSFLRVDDGGSPIGSVRRLAVETDGTSIGGFAGRDTGYALVHTTDMLRFYALNADGTAAAAPVVVVPREAHATALVPRPGGGFLAPWNQSSHARLGRLDGAGNLEGDVAVLGRAGDALPADDGSAWLLWTPSDCDVDGDRLVLSRFDAAFARVHEDIVVDRGPLQSGLSLTRTATTLHAGSTHLSPAASARVISACAIGPPRAP